jgi:hypothetical protein
VAVLEKQVVLGVKIPKDPIIRIAAEQERTGYKNSINDLMLLQPGVARVPETGSALLIRGESQYDYRTVIYGVPLFSASHFNNHTFCDQSGTMIAALDNVSFETERINGRYDGASAAVVKMDPGIGRRGALNLKKRPEVVVNFSTMFMEFLLSTPLPKGKGFHQIAWRFTNDYMIEFLSKGWFSTTVDAGLSYSMPLSYGDIVLTGSTKLGGFTVKDHVWFAYDLYKDNAGMEEKWDRTGTRVEPWGMAGLEIDDPTGAYQFTIGGAVQHYKESKRLGWVYPRKHVDVNSGSITAKRNDLALGPLQLDFNVDLEYLDWYGQVDKTVTVTPDSGSAYDSIAYHTQSGKEVLLAATGGLRQRIGPMQYGGQVLLGGNLPTQRAYVDPSVWLQTVSPFVTTQTDLYIRTSQPDIRGLPDATYRSEFLRTYGATSALRWSRWEPCAVTVSAYCKWRDRSPYFGADPGSPWWHPTEETGLLVRGLSLEAELTANQHLALRSITDVSRSQRIDGTQKFAYEWDVPWSNKSILAFKALDGKVKAYLTGLVSAGLPYRDLYANESGLAFGHTIRRVPFYKRMDLQVQLSQPVDDHRYLTHFDGFIEFRNLLDATSLTGENIREYYWNQDMKKLPILVEPFSFHIGLRVGFRL